MPVYLPLSQAAINLTMCARCSSLLATRNYLSAVACPIKGVVNLFANMTFMLHTRGISQ